MKLRKMDYLLLYLVTLLLLFISSINFINPINIVRIIFLSIIPALVLGTLTNIIFKSKRKLLITLIVLIMLSPIFYGIDAKLVAQEKRPLFVIPTAVAKDGGTTVYNGLGYKVIEWKRLESRQIDGKEVLGRVTGYEISTIFSPQDINRGPEKELKFIPNK